MKFANKAGFYRTCMNKGKSIRNMGESSKIWKLLISVFFLSTTVLHSQVVINEFMADNFTGLADQNGKRGDWIEFYNEGSTNFDLSGLFLTDDPNDLMKWVFPSGSNIGAGEYLVVWAEKNISDSRLNTNFSLSRNGEYLALSTPMGLILDSLTFADQIQDVSYGRYPDGTGNWTFLGVPTPGETNSASGSNLITLPPEFSYPRGFYPSAISLVLTPSQAGNEIYYTTDGSTPNAFSAKVTGPITIDKTQVINAIQYQAGALPSPIVTQTYLINENTSLPVFSLTTDPPNLWDLDTGIYTEGRNYVWGWGNGNFWQDWEKEVYVEFWEKDHKVKINQEAGLRITGALTRTASQKSLRVIARSQYGDTKFDYRMFKEKPITSFNDLVLRSSGNDWARTMMADGTISTIVQGEMDIDRQAYRPGILFLNGQFWGIHNIREKVGDDYIEENHGFDKNNIDLIAQMADLRDGTMDAYNELLTFILTHDMSVSDNYTFAKERIDIQEYINYNVTEIYFANPDWPAGNIKFWRPRIDKGIWRWILYDSDLSFEDPTLNTLVWSTLENPPDYPGSTDLLKGLMKNPEFKEQFLNTFQTLLNTTFDSDRVIHIIDSLQAAIQPEMQRHIARWIDGHGWTFTDPVAGYFETPPLRSYSDWLNYVELFRDFARVRPIYLNSFLVPYFELGSSVQVDFEVVNPNTGRIHLNNGLVIGDTEDAIFFDNQQFTMEALANPGYAFSNWEVILNPYEIGQTVELVPKTSSWKYLDTGTYPGSSWTQIGFDDTSWKTGIGILGYGSSRVHSKISYGNSESNKYITSFFRKEFNLYDASQWSQLTIGLLRDDGAIVYLNGVEVARSNMPETSNYLSLALTNVPESEQFTYFNVTVPVNQMVSGKNVIAVEVHQATASSSDLLFDLQCTALVNKSSSQRTVLTDNPVQQQFGSNTKVVAHFEPTSNMPILYLNEVMPVNTSLITDNYGSFPDWLEIYNPDDQPVDMGGMYLTDNIMNPGKYRIPINQPDKTTVPANGYLLYFPDEKIFLGANHLDFKLNGNGESIGLSMWKDSQFTWIDTLTYPDLTDDISFGRIPDGEKQWGIFNMKPTPGAKNVADSIDQPIGEIELYQNYPNPFSDNTTIRFAVKDETPIQIWVRDLRGNLIRILTNRTYQKGFWEVVWNGRDAYGQKMPPGIYIYTLYSLYYLDSYKALLVE